MPNLTMLLGNSNVYAYQDRTLLPGRLLGTVVRSELYELVLAAEQIIRRYALNAKLMILDSARPRITQAALHLNACRVLYSSGQYKDRTSAAAAAHSFARNPTIGGGADHLTGAAVDVVLVNPMTGLPFEDDLARYDQWGWQMRPHAFDRLQYEDIGSPLSRRRAAMAARESCVREALSKVGLKVSEDEACQASLLGCLGSTADQLQRELEAFMVCPPPFGLEQDLLDECRSHTC